VTAICHPKGLCSDPDDRPGDHANLLLFNGWRRPRQGAGGKISNPEQIAQFRQQLGVDQALGTSMVLVQQSPLDLVAAGDNEEVSALS